MAPSRRQVPRVHDPPPVKRWVSPSNRSGDSDDAGAGLSSKE